MKRVIPFGNAHRSRFSRTRQVGAGGGRPRAETGVKRHIALLCFCALFIIVLLTGGSARQDSATMLVLRPIAVIYVAAILLSPITRRWASVRVPLLFLTGLAITIAIQLVPLPPALWTALPGHAHFESIFRLTGIPLDWQPISLAPDLTLNALAALSVPIAALVGIASLENRRSKILVLALLAAILASAVLGVAQWARPMDNSIFFLPSYTVGDLPVGVFANRNHQAVFLATGFPLLRAWLLLPGANARYAARKLWVAGAVSILLIPMILATGSRSGTILAGLAMGMAWAMAPVRWSWKSRRLPPRTIRLLTGIGLAIVVGLVAAVLLASGRAVSLQRFMTLPSSETELRVRYTPLVIELMRKFLPFGSGFGTFDTVFRMFEPASELRRTYFNRAHNDLLELVMTGGILPLLLLLVFLGWLVRRALPAVRTRFLGEVKPLPLAGLAIITILLLASLSDYPLRTPILSFVFAIACAWLNGFGATGQSSRIAKLSPAP